MIHLRRPSLRLALVLYVVVPLTLVMGVAGYLVFQTFEKRVEMRMKEEVELVARAIRLPLSRALEQGRPGGVEEALASVIGIHRVYGAYVYDLSGEMMASAGVSNPDHDRGRLSDLAVRGRDEGAYEEISGRSVYSYFVPLTTGGGRATGLLHVTRRASDIRDHVARLRWQVIVTLIAAMVSMAGLVLIGHYRAIGKYLERLGRSMQRVEQGEREHRAPRDGPKEIAALGASLNTMLDSIARAEAEIEARRSAQQALEDRLKHAEKLAAIGRLAAGVAHELGTPLSVIEGKAQRMLRRSELDEPMHTALGEIRRQVRRMEHIVRQLLDFGRKHTLQRRAVAADRLADMAAGTLRDEVRRSGTVLDLAGPRPGPVLHVDPLRIEQVLTNLTRNALEAAAGGRVVLSWFEDEEAAGFCVEDDGPGIDPSIRPHLFEPFFTTKGVGEGTGLGLAVVHGIVDEHGGRIEVEQSDLGGARFVIALPATPLEPELLTS